MNTILAGVKRKEYCKLATALAWVTDLRKYDFIFNAIVMPDGGDVWSMQEPSSNWQVVYRARENQGRNCREG